MSEKKVTLKKVISKKKADKYYRMKKPIVKIKILEKCIINHFIKNKIRAFIQKNELAELDKRQKQHWLTKQNITVTKVISSLVIKYSLSELDNCDTQYLTLELGKQGNAFDNKIKKSIIYLKDYFSADIKDKEYNHTIEVSLLFQSPKELIINVNQEG